MTRDESPAGLDPDARSARSFSSRLSSLSDVLAMLIVLAGLSRSSASPRSTSGPVRPFGSSSTRYLISRSSRWG